MPEAATEDTGQAISLFLRKSPRMSAFANEQNLDLNQPITRQEIISRGFAMQNMVGQGSRAIVQEIRGQDVSRKAFLTLEELTQHRKEVVPEEMTDEELEVLGEEMGEFIKDAHVLTWTTETLSPNSRQARLFDNFLWGMC